MDVERLAVPLALSPHVAALVFALLATAALADDRPRMENAVQEARSAREQRLAEREAVFSAMEEDGLLVRTRGDQ